MTKQTNGTASLLDIVSYEDRANPRSAYVVTKIIDSRWGRQYGLVNLDTDEYITSDCRQSGWQTHTNVADEVR